MDNLKKHIIKNIAQELDCGFDCYYNTKTNEIVSIPNFAQIMHEEDFIQAFESDIEKIEKQQTDFIKFEALQSFESFKIMEKFIEQLPHKTFQLELQNVLANKKPFQNFKHQIDLSDYRQHWFDFKQNELERRVENKLNCWKSK